METGRISDTKWLHPDVRDQFEELALALKRGYERGATKTEFRVFETYRTPARQGILHEQGVTKALPWQSPHQYGLAVDFVPFPWSWDAEHDWDYLDKQAARLKLGRPITWDRAHIEHQLFGKVRPFFLFATAQGLA